MEEKEESVDGEEVVEKGMREDGKSLSSKENYLLTKRAEDGSVGPLCEPA